MEWARKGGCRLRSTMVSCPGILGREAPMAGWPWHVQDCRGLDAPALEIRLGRVKGQHGWTARGWTRNLGRACKFGGGDEALVLGTSVKGFRKHAFLNWSFVGDGQSSISGFTPQPGNCAAHGGWGAAQMGRGHRRVMWNAFGAWTRGFLRDLWAWQGAGMCPMPLSWFQPWMPAVGHGCHIMASEWVCGVRRDA